jgi:hypothetical protein
MPYRHANTKKQEHDKQQGHQRKTHEKTKRSISDPTCAPSLHPKHNPIQIPMPRISRISIEIVSPTIELLLRIRQSIFARKHTKALLIPSLILQFVWSLGTAGLERLAISELRIASPLSTLEMIRLCSVEPGEILGVGAGPGVAQVEAGAVAQAVGVVGWGCVGDARGGAAVGVA